MKKKLYIFEPSLLIGKALSLFFNETGYFESTPINNEEELFKKIEIEPPDIILICEEKITNNTYKTIVRLKSSTNSKITILSKSAEEDCLVTLIKMGIDGYFVESMNTDHLVFYLNNVSDGILFYSSRVVNSLIERLSITEISDLGPSLLTAREIQILPLVCSGSSTEYISKKLFISKSTVKNHLKNIYKKLEAKNRTDAVIKAMEKGLFIFHK